MALYQIWNAPAPTTAKIVAVTTGTAIKTMLQVKPSATLGARVVEWGWKCDAPSASALCSVELIVTDVAATVTAHVAAGIMKLDAAAMGGGDPSTNLIQVGTTSTGYTSSGEGTITASRVLDSILETLPTTNGYGFVKQFPLGYQPYIEINGFLRIRNHLGSAVNALCYVTLEV